MHLRSLAAFDFDSVLFPYNFAMLGNTGYRDDVECLLELCAARNVAVQTIKSVARRRWADPSTPHHSWYEPLPHGEALRRAVNYVLSNQQLFLNSSSDARLLPSILDVAGHAPQLPSDDELREDARVLDIAALFDGAELERI